MGWPTTSEAVALAERLHRPVALKVSHRDVRHKTEIGGVVLGLSEPAEVAAATDRLLALADGAVVLVEEMAPPGVEMLVSATRDGVVPSLVIGLGGIWTELLDDVLVIPLPADTAHLRKGLERLRGYPLSLRRARPSSPSRSTHCATSPRASARPCSRSRSHSSRSTRSW